MEQYNSIQQLLKKEGGKKKNPVFPPTVVQAVFDAKTGASLEAILAQFNSVYLQYQGTPQATRLIIPKEMRRAGLTITYMNMDSETITERANSAVQKDNDHWGLDVNWSRVDELSLSGEITVSAQGTWIINGSDTGVKAVGPKGEAGITPWLKNIDNRLHFSYDNVNWEPCSDPISAYFRWSNNKIQISRDNKTWTDLSGTFADNVHIKGYVATTSALPSGAAQGDIYGVGPTYAEDDTEKLNPIYRYYVRNAGTWVDNGSFTSIAAGVVQETGDSETEVMSQKAVSAKLTELGSKVKTVLESEGGDLIQIDLSKEIKQDCSLGGDGWYNEGVLGCAHKAVKIGIGIYQLSVTAEKGCFIGFVTDKYNPPYKVGETVPYVEGTTRIHIEANNEKVLDIPLGASYIVFTVIDGEGSIVTYKDLKLVTKEGILIELNEQKEIASHLNAVVLEDERDEIVDLEKIQRKECCFGSDGTWFSEGNRGSYHKAVKLGMEYGSTTIVPKNNCFVGFVTNKYNPPYKIGESIPYVKGESRISISANTTTSLDIPLDAAYLILTTSDGSGNDIEYSEVKIAKRPSLVRTSVKTEKEIKELSDAINGAEKETIIDLSVISRQDCSLGSSGWYRHGSGSYHKAVKLGYGYGQVVITPDKYTFVGFVTDEYNPPYQQNTPIPYVKGESRVGIAGNSTATLNIPNGSAYLILTTRDGSGNDIEYSEVRLIPSDSLPSEISKIKGETRYLSKIKIKEENAPRSIFGVMCYNVGGWYNGSGVSIPSSYSEVYVPLQTSVLDRYSPDIVLIQEYRDSVVSGGVSSSEFLEGYYLNSVSGDTSYNGKAFASKFKVFDIEKNNFVNDDGTSRCYLKGYSYCNGKKVLFVSAHLSTQKNIASLEIDELINVLDGEEYVVLGMDSNVNILSEDGVSIMKKITDAGYTYINNSVVTYPKSNAGIDNIVVSRNINIKSVFADTQKSILGEDADHYPLLAYLEIF